MIWSMDNLSGLLLLELKEAPPLPLPESAHPKSKTKMDEMENFLDDLLG